MTRHRLYKPRRTKPATHCQHCGVKRTPNRLYYYVDGNNGAITANSPGLCFECYEQRYGPQERPLQEMTK